MSEQIIDLNRLIKRYKNELSLFKKKMGIIQQKMDIAYQALQLLQDEGAMAEDLFKTETKIIPESLSEKYKGLPMRKAMSEVLKAHSNEYLTGKQIYDDLMKHGFTSKSKALQRDVYVQLYRMQKERQLESITDENGRKRYRLAFLSNENIRGIHVH